MRRSSWRAPGSAAQPISWPWVSDTARSMPARRRRPSASRPSGAPAPNQTLSQPCDRAISAARRATAGVGSRIPVSSRITSNGCSASKAAASFQVEA
jgi:hypothetical protein